MNHTLTTIAATILTLGLAAPAAADIPLATDNAITAASGNRANGFTLTFAGGGTWHTDPFHTELATCRASSRPCATAAPTTRRAPAARSAPPSSAPRCASTSPSAPPPRPTSDPRQASRCGGCRCSRAGHRDPRGTCLGHDRGGTHREAEGAPPLPERGRCRRPGLRVGRPAHGQRQGPAVPVGSRVRRSGRVPHPPAGPQPAPLGGVTRWPPCLLQPGTSVWAMSSGRPRRPRLLRRVRT